MSDEGETKVVQAPEETPTQSNHAESWTSRVAKQATGTAMLTTVGTAMGAAYGAIKKNGIKSSATIGGFIGFASSLGLGRSVYDALTGQAQATPDKSVLGRSGSFTKNGLHR